MRFLKELKREPSVSPSLLVGIGLRIAHIIWESIRGRFGFTQKLVSAPILLNSRRDVMTERRSFFVRCRRIYVINKRELKKKLFKKGLTVPLDKVRRSVTFNYR